jgi:predicted lysophospholipase L1 biosynthesis ABC-type transport system permease subunit
MEHPTYGIDVVALTLAVLLAAAIVLIGSQLMDELADQLPPALSGSP